MKTPYLYLLTISLLVLFLACEKNEPIIIEGDFLVFSRFNGFCVGETCIELFKLTDTQLFEDTADRYAQYPDCANNLVELSKEKFDLVSDLPASIPTELLTAEEDSLVFGCPDCADQGGLLFKYQEDDKIRYWIIDQNKSAVPDYLHDFVEEVKKKIQLLE